MTKKEKKFFFVGGSYNLSGTKNWRTLEFPLDFRKTERLYWEGLKRLWPSPRSFLFWRWCGCQRPRKRDFRVSRSRNSEGPPRLVVFLFPSKGDPVRNSKIFQQRLTWVFLGIPIELCLSRGRDLFPDLIYPYFSSRFVRRDKPNREVKTPRCPSSSHHLPTWLCRVLTSRCVCGIHWPHTLTPFDTH